MEHLAYCQVSSPENKRVSFFEALCNHFSHLDTSCVWTHPPVSQVCIIICLDTIYEEFKKGPDSTNIFFAPGTYGRLRGTRALHSFWRFPLISKITFYLPSNWKSTIRGNVKLKNPESYSNPTMVESVASFLQFFFNPNFILAQTEHGSVHRFGKPCTRSLLTLPTFTRHSSPERLTARTRVQRSEIEAR